MFPEDPVIDVGMSGGIETTLKTVGRLAHGSQPQMGVNAIDQLIKVIAHAKRLEDFVLDVFDQMKPVYESSIEYYVKQETLTAEQKAGFIKSFRHPTVSLNLIKGGVKSNVVPDMAEAYLDVRIRSGCNMTPIKEKLQELIRESQVKDVTLDMKGPNLGYYELPESKPVKELVKTVELAVGKKPTLKLETGGNDCIFIKEVDPAIPCLGFGAGDEGLAHLTNEYVSAVNLVMTAKVYAAFPMIFEMK